MRTLGAALLATAVLSYGCGSEGVPGGTTAREGAEEALRGVAGSEPIPDRFELGRPASDEEIRVLAIAVMPDGRGLPPGSGTPSEGAPVYAEQCADCHGTEGEGGSGGRLVGRIPDDRFDFGDGMEGPRTIGSYWPYATTVFDYTRRAMPWDRPGTLTDDEVYAVTAYLLHLNEIIGPDDVMDAETLPRVVMPAHGRFVPDDREGTNRIH